MKWIGTASFIFEMPRYQKFTDSAEHLLEARARFVEIAGNRKIVVTAIVPRDWSFQLPVGELFFSSEVLTNGMSKRVVLRVPVRSLGLVIGVLPVELNDGYRVESSG